MTAPVTPVIPAQQDFTFQRGSTSDNALVAAQIKNPDGSLVELTGATADITASVNGAALATDSSALSVDLPSSTISWFPTLAQTNAMPLGRVTKYTVWITFSDGTREPYLEGFLIGAMPAIPPVPGVPVTATIVLRGPQGIPGPSGPPGPSFGSFESVEVVAIADGGQAIPLSTPPTSWYTLYVNGIRQSRAAYGVSSTQVTIPAEMSIVQTDVLAFDYLPAST